MKAVKQVDRQAESRHKQNKYGLKYIQHTMLQPTKNETLIGQVECYNVSILS